jgi:heme-degrading monooxygenase HmoA
MFVVVFEVHPAPGKKDEYLGLAKHLKPMLELIDGFIDNERFESKRHEGWVLSLSTWRDEKSVVRWRSLGKHHGVQSQGRNGIFDDYHLRVCEVTADSKPPEGLQVTQQRLDETEVGEAKALGITEMSPQPNSTFADPDVLPTQLGFDRKAEGLTDHDLFESIYNPGKMLLLTSWKTRDDAARWTPSSFGSIAELRHRRVRNVRDYGMYDRREAAQYYPDVKPPGAS